MKKAQISIEKIPKLIIVAIVIVLVLLLFWKTNVFEKFVNFIPDNWQNSGEITPSDLPEVRAVSLDVGKMKEVMEYVKKNSVVNRKCDCKDKCDVIAESTISASKEYGIPNPLLLLSIMMQESSCRYDAGNSGSIGLMQITENTFRNICKGKIRGVNSFSDIKGSSNENIRNNIYCGVLILRSKYNQYGKKGVVFKGCFNRNVKYYEWQAAVRGYNGLKCPDTNNEQIKHETDYYVDNVIARLNILEEKAQ